MDSLIREIHLREVMLVIVTVLAVYGLLAIASFSQHDPAWTYAGSNLKVHNLMGPAGAMVADVLLFLFGWAAYLLPLGCLGGVAKNILGKRLQRPDLADAAANADGKEYLSAILAIRTAGAVICLIALCALLALHGPGTVPLPDGPGGIIGTTATELATPVVGVLGLSLFAAAGLGVGAQAAIGFSWVHVVERIGRALFVVAKGMRVGAGWTMRHLASWARHFISWVQKLAVRMQTLYERRKAEREAEDAIERVPAEILPAPAPPEPEAGEEIFEAAESPLAKLRNRKKHQEIAVVPPASPAPKPYSQGRLFEPEEIGELPDLELLDDKASGDEGGYSEESLRAMSQQLEFKLADFGIEAEVVSVLPGPVVTRFEIQPAAGVKVSKISSLVKDLARSLAVVSVRIVEVIPGKSVVGIEIPNQTREMVRLKDVLNTPSYHNATAPLTLALGKDIAGEPFMADIAKMPHLLVAGTTGSGKSVAVNAMLLSLLYKCTPDDLRLILVDPKMLELAVYDGIPHLLTPVVTDMKEAAHALNWCVGEMDRRYRVMAGVGVRNLAGYNRRIDEAEEAGEPLRDPDVLDEDDDEAILERLPLVVVVIDEFADMMMIVGKKVEQLIARIAQKARAAGIHLVLATQRPSVDVITGLIKANIPARIGFQVSSKVDSRTILDQGGAEQLLGHGDMLYLPPGTAVPIRLHGAFVSDDEVHAVVNDWKRRGEPQYLEGILGDGEQVDISAMLEGRDPEDGEAEPLYDEAVAYVLESRKASISSVQRKLRIGYNRAARLIEAMELAGVVSPMNSNGGRDVLVPHRE